MAIKIIYKPKNNDIAVEFICSECSCRFYADKYDMWAYTKDKSLWAARCPNCDKIVVSDTSPIPRGKIFNVFDKILNWIRKQKRLEMESYYDRYL